MVLPVVGNQGRAVIARWYFAKAANAIELGQSDPEVALQGLDRWTDSPEAFRDYWIVQMKRAVLNSPEELPELLQRATDVDPRNRSLGDWVYQQMYNQERYDIAVPILEFSSLGRVRYRESYLNQIAYTRALGLVDLDKGLSEINEALEIDPESSALRDTRAWILFQMGRTTEALEDADFAVRRAEKEYEEYTNSLFYVLENWVTAKPQPSSEDGLLSEEEAGIAYWSLAVLHYHRAKILEALGRESDAKEEWTWLEKNHFPTDGQLR